MVPSVALRDLSFPQAKLLPMSLAGRSPDPLVTASVADATAPLTLGTWTLLVPVAFVTRSLLFTRAFVDMTLVITCPSYACTTGPFLFTFCNAP